MIELQEIIQSHQRIKRFIHRTSILTNSWLNDLVGAELYCKCENFQKTGAFKIRGATNAVEQLSKNELDKGVATASSGNHGAALAMAVTRRGGKISVVMPVYNEGEIIDTLHDERHWAQGIIINPGALSHYSYAIMDAIKAIQIPTIEVHITDLNKRAHFRKTSVVSAVCIKQISGLGKYSYLEGVKILTKEK